MKIVAPILAIAPMFLAAAARAQWTVVNLHPSNASRSFAYTSFGNQQYGSVRVNNRYRAAQWYGAASTLYDLNPPNCTWSQIVAAAPGRQVGVALLGDRFCATLWTGNTVTNLHPSPGFPDSEGRGCSATNQVGLVTYGDGFFHASLWTGTPESWVDLHPPGAVFSAAWATAGAIQVGHGQIGSQYHAFLWRGTAASWVDLNPAGSTESFANGAWGNQQVGSARFGGVTQAGLWSATPSSWVSLHPANATGSFAAATCESFQAGWAVFDSVNRAGIWSGSASSWEDLHAVLPGSWGETYAEHIRTDGTTIFVTGYGFNGMTARNEALLWTRPVSGGPVCGSPDYNGDGDIGTDQDIEAYFRCLAGNCCAAYGPTADFNGDGDIGTDADIESFFSVLAGGACRY